MYCILQDDRDGNLYIARKRDVESGEVFFTDGRRDYFILLQEEDEYQDKSFEKAGAAGARLSFGETLVLLCLLGLVFFWIPVGLLLWRFLG